MKIIDNCYKEETRKMYCTHCKSFLDVSEKDIMEDKNCTLDCRISNKYFFICPCCERKNFLPTDHVLVNLRYGIN